MDKRNVCTSPTPCAMRTVMRLSDCHCVELVDVGPVVCGMYSVRM